MYVFLRDRSYLYYIACIAWYGIFALLFSQSFLHTKHHTPHLHKAMSFLIGFGGVVSIAGIFLSYSIAVRMAAAFSVFQTILILTTGVITLLKGVKAAKYFVLAWTTVLVGVSLFALLANGLVPANFLTHYSAQFGSVMEVILLSLALADRLRQVEKDKTRLEKEANDALKKANKDLSIALDQRRKSSRLKDEFLATLSHELRTPMNGVEAAMELAKNEQSPSKSLEHLDVASDSAKSITYNLNVDKNVNSNIKTDRRALALILNHLLDNAVKFTTSGEVTLSIQQSDTYDPQLIFVISDSGIGVPPNATEDIFKPFHQLDGSFKRGYGGLGIGLAICRALAAKMAINTKGKILVVEDNMVNQKILVAILKKLGLEAITANDGVEALSILEKEQTTLIFMDCQMPNMDGFEATQQIRESDKPYHSLPIIAVTANAMSGDRARCLDAGMDDYIKKPINKVIIEKKLSEWLPSHSEAAAG